MQSKNQIFKFILTIGDIFFMYFALLLALAIRYGDFSFLPGPQTKIFLIHFSFIHLIWLLILFLLDFYEIPPLKNPSEFFSHLIIFLFLAFAIGNIYFYFQPGIIIAPKTILLLNVLMLGILFFTWRIVFKWFLLRVLKFKEKILFLGSSPLLKEIISEVFSRDEYNVLYKYDKQKKPDLIVLTPENLTEDFFKLNCLSFEIFYENLFKKIPIDFIHKSWFLKNLKKKGNSYEFFKRFFDIIFSVAGLVIAFILFPFIALFIKLTCPGPIFYKHKRAGKEGKIFTLYKFRTMIVEAEKNGAQWAVKNDSRITKFGKFLRTTHLDELPQFYNIFKGDISFVGPRPERPEFIEKLKKEIPFYEARNLVKPGLTGWAQIKYKYSASREEAKEKLKYDFYYLKHCSFVFDLAIILKTIKHFWLSSEPR